ncbi:MAG: hypothetical protein E7016_05780 [Alphaproteobacteria bacterium]|nr:hypothetical protein [Alphaproteobacteria bacterium]
MSKYFVLILAFMLASTNVNATTDYAEVTAKATIEIAEVIQCPVDKISFGVITVKLNNTSSTVTIGDGQTTFTGDVISVSGEKAANCGNVDLNWNNVAVTITNEEDDALIINNFKVDSSYNIGGTLHIPPQAGAGSYTGTFMVTNIK